ncbi:MAG: YtxH domain-containing protein [Acidimicrobiales bacterium]
MRFKLGAAIGFAAGYLVATRASDERRRQVDDAIERVRENPRVRHVSEVVTRDAKRIGDAVEDRFAKTADHVVETVATTVEPESSAVSDTPTSSSGAGKTSKNAAKSASNQ